MKSIRYFFYCLLVKPTLAPEPDRVRGIKHVFGIPKEIKKVHGLPGTPSKLVLEVDKLALVVFMGDRADRYFYLEDRGEFWVPSFERKREALLS